MSEIRNSITLSNGDAIVLLEWEGKPETFCNLQRRDAAGKIIWTAAATHPLEGVWTTLQMEDGLLIAHNFSGYRDEIDCGSGRVLKRTFVK